MNPLTNYFNAPFYQQYQNPEVVLIAFFIIIFAATFGILIKTKIFERPVNVIISLVIALFSLAYIPKIYEWTASFNIFLFLAVIGLIILIGIPFLKFIKKNIIR